MGISNSSLSESFAYTGGIGGGSWGATSTLSRVIGAVAETGQRLNFLQPSSQGNISYQIQAFVPLMRCDTANASTQAELVTDLIGVSQASGPFDINLAPVLNSTSFYWIYENTGNPENISVNSLGNIGYFGVVPFMNGTLSNNVSSLVPWWDSSAISTVPVTGLQGQFIAALQVNNTPPTTLTLPGTNVVIADSNYTEMQFLSCQLYNASVKVQVNFTDGISNSTVLESTWIEDLDGSNFLNYSNSNQVFFQELSKYLIGVVSWTWNNFYLLNQLYQDTGLLDTYMATGAQVYNMYKSIDYIYNSINGTSPSSADDLAPNQIRNISLMQDIENFVLNCSLSMLSDSALWYGNR
jgi:hypothetical protein